MKKYSSKKKISSSSRHSRNVTIESIMNKNEKQHGVIGSYHQALQNRNAVKNSQFDLDVANVLVQAKQTNTPIKFELKIADLNGKKVASTGGNIPNEIINTTDALHISTNLNVGMKVPLDHMIQLKLQNIIDRDSSRSSRLNEIRQFSAAKTVASMNSTVALTDPELSGVDFSNGKSYNIVHSLYNDLDHEEHIKRGLPISNLYSHVESAGKDKDYLTLNSVTVMSNFSNDKHAALKANTIGEVIGSHVGYSGSTCYRLKKSRQSSIDVDYQSFHKRVVSGLKKIISTCKINKDIQVITGKGQLDGSVSERELSCSGKVHQRRPVFLGPVTSTLGTTAFVNLWAKLEYKVADIFKQSVVKELLGDDSVVANNLEYLYTKYNESISDIGPQQTLPTIYQLLTHTSGLPVTLKNSQAEFERVQKSLLQTLSNTLGANTKNITDAQLQQANEKEFARLLLGTQLQHKPGSIVLPYNFVEGAILSILIVRMAQKLKAEDVDIPEDAILYGIEGLIDLDDDNIDWNPQLSEDGKYLEASGDSTLYASMNDAYTSLYDVLKIPAFFMQESGSAGFGIADSMRAIEVAIDDTTDVFQSIGWTRVDIGEGTYSLYISQGGARDINALVLYYIPELNIYGAVNAYNSRSKLINPENLEYSHDAGYSHNAIAAGIYSVIPEVLRGIIKDSETKKKYKWSFGGDDNDKMRKARRKRRARVPDKYHTVVTLGDLINQHKLKYIDNHNQLVEATKNKNYTSFYVDPLLNRTQTVQLVGDEKLPIMNAYEYNHEDRSLNKDNKLFSVAFNPKTNQLHQIYSKGKDFAIGNSIDMNAKDLKGFSANGTYYSATKSLPRHNDIQQAIQNVCMKKSAGDKNDYVSSVFSKSAPVDIYESGIVRKVAAQVIIGDSLLFDGDDDDDDDQMISIGSQQQQDSDDDSAFSVISSSSSTTATNASLVGTSKGVRGRGRGFRRAPVRRAFGRGVGVGGRRGRRYARRGRRGHYGWIPVAAAAGLLLGATVAPYRAGFYNRFCRFPYHPNDPRCPYNRRYRYSYY